MLAYAIAHEPSFGAAIGGIGGLGALLLALVLRGRADELLPWAIALLGGAYALSLVAHAGGGVDGRAPLVAAGLFACAELAAWSVQERHGHATPFTITLARGVAVAALTLVGLAVAGLLLAAAAAPAGNGPAWTVLGAAAAVAILTIAARLAQHAR